MELVGFKCEAISNILGILILKLAVSANVFLSYGQGSGPFISSSFRYRVSFAHDCAKIRFGCVVWYGIWYGFSMGLVWDLVWDLVCDLIWDLVWDLLWDLVWD